MRQGVLAEGVRVSAVDTRASAADTRASAADTRASAADTRAPAEEEAETTAAKLRVFSKRKMKAR
jgi:hypothetical protein